MDSIRKSTKKIVASGFVFLMLLALLATGASAADQLRDRDQIQDPDQIRDKDQARDGSCLETAISSLCDQTQDRLCDQTQDRLRDGSCTEESSRASGCEGDCDRVRLRDGSCLE